MPDDKNVSAKPRYKVEEVDDVKTPEPAEEIQKAPTEKPISSFSMVDSPVAKDSSLLPPKHEEVEKPEVKDVPHESPSPLPEDMHPLEPQEAEEVPAEPLDTSDEKSGDSGDEIKEWLQNVRPDNSSEKAKSGGGAGKFVAVFLTVMILAALGGGIYYYRANVEESGNIPQKEAVIEEPQGEVPPVTTAPTPTTVAVDFSKYKVQILNGGGVAGEAGKAQGYLTTAGFKDFKTGNASAFTYTNTEVSLKPGTPEEVFTKVKEELEKYYTSVVKADKELTSSSEFDLQVVVGKKK